MTEPEREAVAQQIAAEQASFRGEWSRKAGPLSDQDRDVIKAHVERLRRAEQAMLKGTALEAQAVCDEFVRDILDCDRPLHFQGDGGVAPGHLAGYLESGGHDTGVGQGQNGQGDDYSDPSSESRRGAGGQQENALDPSTLRLAHPSMKEMDQDYLSSLHSQGRPASSGRISVEAALKAQRIDRKCEYLKRCRGAEEYAARSRHELSESESRLEHMRDIGASPADTESIARDIERLRAEVATRSLWRASQLRELLGVAWAGCVVFSGQGDPQRQAIAQQIADELKGFYGAWSGKAGSLSDQDRKVIDSHAARLRRAEKVMREGTALEAQAVCDEFVRDILDCDRPLLFEADGDCVVPGRIAEYLEARGIGSARQEASGTKDANSPSPAKAGGSQGQGGQKRGWEKKK